MPVNVMRMPKKHSSLCSMPRKNDRNAAEQMMENSTPATSSSPTISCERKCNARHPGLTTMVNRCGGKPQDIQTKRRLSLSHRNRHHRMIAVARTRGKRRRLRSQQLLRLHRVRRRLCRSHRRHTHRKRRRKCHSTRHTSSYAQLSYGTRQRSMPQENW